MNSEYDNEILKQYIESIRFQLKELNMNYQLNYIFGFAYKANDITMEFKRGLFYNRLINLSVLNNFIMDLIKLKQELAFWLNLIEQGRQVVFTLYDSGSSYTGDKLFSGEFYLIKDFIVDHNDRNFRYTLFGRDSGYKEGGYEYGLFVRMFSLKNNN